MFLGFFEGSEELRAGSLNFSGALTLAAWAPFEPFRGHGGQNVSVDLARVAWSVTVFACLVAILVLVLEGYLGYAGVTLAVAISAAINLG